MFKGQVVPFVFVLYLSFEVVLCENTCSTVNQFLAMESGVSEELGGITQKIDYLKNKANRADQELMIFRNEYSEYATRWKVQIQDANSRFNRLTKQLNQLDREIMENEAKITSMKRRRDENQIEIENAQDRMKSIRETCSAVLSNEKTTSCLRDVTGRDCAEVHQQGGRENGIYFITANANSSPVPVYCDQETDGGGWTYIHSHVDDEFDFNRSWMSYKHGFGHVTCDGVSNFWMGNDLLHALTALEENHLRVDITDWSGNGGYATYTTFSVGSESEDYRLRIDGYRKAEQEDSVIGDGFRGHNFGHADDIHFTDHNGMKFSTFDRDNDKYRFSCARQDGGGWWFNQCSAVNLNGRVYDQGFYDAKDTMYGFDNGMIWGPWTGLWYSLKTSNMKIRPASFKQGG